MTFAVEMLTPDKLPIWMLGDHYEENAKQKDALKLAPDWGQYMAAQRTGEFFLVVARNDAGDVVGYMAIFLRRHPHYRDVIVAVDDVHYLMPVYRGQGGGKDMITFAEIKAHERGATVFSMRTKADQKSTHGYIFESLGYELTDLVYVKDLRNAPQESAA